MPRGGVGAGMDGSERVILIGGSSHAGKSTLARHLAGRLGWEARSTDHLARHPGRPWGPQVPPHVAEHYLGLEIDDLIAAVVAHYQRIWPLSEQLVRDHAGDPSMPGLVLEGSALLPDRVAALPIAGVSAIWLIGDNGLHADRIRAESGYEATRGDARTMIDRFVARTLRFNQLMLDQVVRLDLPFIIVERDTPLERLGARLLRAMRPLRLR